MSTALSQERKSSVAAKMEALEIDAAITDLARVIGATAVKHLSSAELAPVLAHLVKARRALREGFGL